MYYQEAVRMVSQPWDYLLLALYGEDNPQD